jgi:hypothetical protein
VGLPIRRWIAASVICAALLSSVDASAVSVVVDAQSTAATAGSILAVSGIQVVWLDLEAPRPRPLTRLSAPASALHVGALPDQSRAVVSVATSFPGANAGAGGGNTARGADIELVDLDSGNATPLVTRRSASDSLVMPVWWPDGNSIVYEHDNLSGQTVGAPGQEVPRYPSSVEVVGLDGQNAWGLDPSGREPSVSPDGSRVVFARTTNQGASLLSWLNGSGVEQTLVPEGHFADVAYPHFSPDGAQIAFVAPQSGLNSNQPAPAANRLELAEWLSLRARVADAHGIPWDPWIMNSDGSDLHRAAVVGGDEPSVAWSPDGTQLFVYSGIGSTIVDIRTGETIPLGFVKGYGPTAWLP